MYLYFNSSGVLKEIINDKAIRQGDGEGVNNIYFFIEGGVIENNVYKALSFVSGTRTFYDEEGNILGVQDETFSLETETLEIPYDKKRELKFFKYWTEYEFFKIEVPDDVTNISQSIGCRIRMVPDTNVPLALGFIVFNVEYTGGKAVITEDIAINVAQWNWLIGHMLTDVNTYTKEQIDEMLAEYVTLDTEQTVTGKKTLESTGNITPATGSTYEVGSSSKPYSNVHTDSVNSIPVNSFENKNNKTTTITASSTDTQYPSAKAVWDTAQDVREVAAGKSANYSLSYNASAPSPMSYSSYYYVNNDGEVVKFESYDEMNTYMTGLTLSNSEFNSQNDMVSFVTPYFNGKYLLLVDNQGRNIIVKLSEAYRLFKLGDNILITELEVPDRWVQTSNAMYEFFYKLETAKMSNYYTKSESLISTGDGTYDIGSSSYYWGKAYITDEIYLKSANGSYVAKMSSDNNGFFYFTDRGFQTFRIKEDEAYFKKLYPWGSSGYTIGNSSNVWDCVFTLSISDGTNSYTVAESFGVIFNKLANGTTVIKWSEFCVFDLSANTTFTFETPKSSSVPEYKAIISNNGGSNITLTFTSVTNILCNDDNCTVTNGTNSTLVLPTGVSIEISVLDNMMVAINFEAQ